MSALAANATMSPQTNCRLFTLPLELRQQIYREVFTVKRTVYGAMNLSPKHGFNPYCSPTRPFDFRLLQPPPPSALALVETCQLLYTEAQPYFYESNSIEICGPLTRQQAHTDPARNHWLWARASSVVAWYSIHDMTVNITCAAQGEEIFRFLRMVLNLRKVTLTIHHDVARKIAAYLHPSCRGCIWSRRRPEKNEWFFWETGAFKMETGVMPKAVQLGDLRRTEGVEELNRLISLA